MFLPRRLYIALAAIAFIMALGYKWHNLFTMGQVMLALLVVLVVVDTVVLWRKRGISASRQCDSRMSNGDENEVTISISSTYPFASQLEVIDEVPVQMQQRDVCYRCRIDSHDEQQINYTLRPTHRGNYDFGRIRVFARTALGLVMRRFTCGEPQTVRVYPSYMMLNQYELLAINNNLTQMGIKRIRRVGNNTDFEQIKDYVQGDEYRTINWKATARRAQLMVNVYQEEKSQQMFCIIDTGRLMQHVVDGLTLLDHAVNASLVLSYVATHRQDKAGLVTFDGEVRSFVQANSHSGHIQTVLETLYAVEASHQDSDFENLCQTVNRLIGKRSLLVLFTQLDNMTAVKRKLPYLTQLSRHHRLLVVFFNDSDVDAYLQEKPKTSLDYYTRVVAQKNVADRRHIVATLKQHGILTLLTTPQQLSINVINSYLDIRRHYVI